MKTQIAKLIENNRDNFLLPNLSSIPVKKISINLLIQFAVYLLLMFISILLIYFLIIKADSLAGAQIRSVIIFLPAGLGFWLFNVWFRKAQQLLAPLTLYAAIEEDERNAILFLRAFSTDQIKYSTSMPTNMPVTMALKLFDSNWDIEEAVVNAFSEVGPTFAVGQPGEKFPKLGSHRLYISSDHWQDMVLSLMDLSGFVVVRVGEGNGLRWEIEQLVTSQNIFKCIFLLANKGGKPMAVDEYNSWKSSLSTPMQKKIPSDLTQPVWYIYFDIHGQYHVIEASTGKNTDFESNLFYSTDALINELSALADSGKGNPIAANRKTKTPHGSRQPRVLNFFNIARAIVALMFVLYLLSAFIIRLPT